MLCPFGVRIREVQLYFCFLKEVLSRGTVYYPVQGGSTFDSVVKTPMCDHSKVIQISCGTVYYAVQDG